LEKNSVDIIIIISIINVVHFFLQGTSRCVSKQEGSKHFQASVKQNNKCVYFSFYFADMFRPIDHQQVIFTKL